MWTFKIYLANTFIFPELILQGEKEKMLCSKKPKKSWKFTTEIEADQPSKTKHSIYNICCPISLHRKLFPGKIINKRTARLEQSRKLIIWKLNVQTRVDFFFFYLFYTVIMSQKHGHSDAVRCSWSMSNYIRFL